MSALNRHRSIADAIGGALRFERRTLRISQYCETLSRLSHALIGKPTYHALYEQACRICIDTKVADMAWVEVLDSNGMMTKVTWSLRSREHADRTVIDALSAALQRTVVCAIAEGLPVTVGRDQADESMFAWRECAAKFGVNAAAAVPIHCDGGAIGVLNLCASVDDYSGEEVASLLTSISENIALGLAAIRSEEALREAGSAEFARATFLSKVSHELRTPLNAILGFTNLLLCEKTIRPLKERDQLNHILVAATHLRALIDDVMDVSRIEAGGLTLNFEHVHVETLLQDVACLCQPLADKASIGIRMQFAMQGHTMIRSDPVRIRQVLINLVTNAIKYSRPGSQVTLGFTVEESTVVFAVEDAGLGMSEQQLASLFQPFNRLGRERSGIEGTGIGLSLARQLVDLMGGSLRIKSSEGEGTHVEVQLAIGVLSEHIATGTAPDLIDDAVLDSASPCGRVLHIEDDPVNVLLVEQLLRGLPSIVIENAPTGEIGLRIARQMLPDLVLLDMSLPDMSGHVVLTTLRADQVTSDLPIVVLSASALHDDVERALAAGANDYWTKPLDFAKVIRGVTEVIRARQQGKLDRAR